MERCCIAWRPASVSRVITTVETPHNTDRQREVEEEEKECVWGGGNRLKKRRKLRKIR